MFLRNYFSQFVKHSGNAIWLGLLSFMICIILTWLLTVSEEKRFKETLHGQTIKQLSKIRARLETEINANFYLTRGMVAHIASNPEINKNEFRQIAQILLRHKNLIKNIAMAPNNIISFVYPEQGNEKAIGLDYQQNKEQWPAIKRIIETGTSVVAGPVHLVQGGTAFICRSPIYIFDRDPEKDIYWGLASIVIDKDALFQAARRYST